MAAVKVCTRCKAEKPVSEFHRRAKSPDGHVSQCKECVRAYQKGYYRDNSEVVRRKVAEQRRRERLELFWYRKNYPQKDAPWLA